MGEPVVKLQDVSKDYGKGRGIFGIDLALRPGEICGYVGTNGAGKTTTIRTIMGFIRPDRGSVTVMGKNAWKNAPALMEHISYVPGEIEFPAFRTGLDLLRYQAGFLAVQDETHMNELIDRLKLDPTADLKRMSKGMKQKTAIVAAFMADKDILLLDEPTTGLDPLMRKEFLEILKEERQKGKAILMSTHIFEEVEEVCDRVALIHHGQILSKIDVDAFLHGENRVLRVYFHDPADKARLAAAHPDQAEVLEDHCRVELAASGAEALFRELGELSVRQIREDRKSLESYFGEILKRKEEER